MSIYLKAALIVAACLVGAAVFLVLVGGWLWLAISLGKEYGEGAYYSVMAGPSILGVYIFVVAHIKRNTK
jgi:hypothetical protein